jgi:hypothetical protein
MQELGLAQGACELQGSPISDLRGSPSRQTKLRKMMDPTKIAPFDNVDLFILRNFLTFPSFNSKRGCIARWDRRGGESSRPTRERDSGRSCIAVYPKTAMSKDGRF